MVRPVWTGRSRRQFVRRTGGQPSFCELAPCCTFGRSRQRARPVSLELGQPFHHQRGPRQCDAARARPTRQQPRRAAPANGQCVYRRRRQPQFASLSVNYWCTNPNPGAGPLRGIRVLSRARGRVLDECLPYFFTLHFHFTSTKAAIAAAASARTLKL